MSRSHSSLISTYLATFSGLFARLSANRFFVASLLAAGMVLPAQSASAQVVQDPLLYTHQAVQFAGITTGAFQPAQFMPGTAYRSESASIFDNPASAALLKKSFLEIGLGWQSVTEEADYLGNRPTMDDRQLSLNSLSFGYSLPTSQGSLVVGMGFNQLGTFNRALSINGTNTANSITDQFKIPGSYYHDIAFDAYAIDYWDVDQTVLESIFRIGFDPGDFARIDQEAEVFERGNGWAFTFFGGTEFRENLFFGVSLGLNAYTKQYDRSFLEIDSDNIFDGDFIDTNDDGEGDSDVDRVFLVDEISTDAASGLVRFGLIYKLGENVRLGASAQLPSTITATEYYDATIRTTMDNTRYFEASLNGEFDYTIRQPGSASLGFSVGSDEKLAASFSFDYSNYAGIEMDYKGSESFLDERIDNTYIRNTFQAVWDSRAGVTYTFDSGLMVEWGASNLPSRFKDGGSDRRNLMLGLRIPLQDGVWLNIATQRNSWSENSLLYNFEDGFFQPGSQTVDRDVNQFFGRATLTMSF